MLKMSTDEMVYLLLQLRGDLIEYYSQQPEDTDEYNIERLDIIIKAIEEGELQIV